MFIEKIIGGAIRPLRGRTNNLFIVSINIRPFQGLINTKLMTLDFALKKKPKLAV